MFAVKTRALIPPKDNVKDEIFKVLKRVPERSILAITSKAVSIEEGRCVLVASVKNKDALIKNEAEFYLPRSAVPGNYIMHTLKNNTLIPTAGVDQSNGRGHYILWPKRPYISARNYWTFFRRKYRVKNFGIIITDSRSIPLRRGVTGFALAYYGFSPLNDYRGKKDIFGDTLVFSQGNIADGLAAAATLAMGEGNERQPVALITDLPFVSFKHVSPRGGKRRNDSFLVPLREDLYAPFLKRVNWKRGGVDKTKNRKHFK